MAKRKAPSTGRKQGQKNLIRTGNTITNQWGVQISKEEEKRLRNAVQTVNRKRKKMEEAFRNMPVFEGLDRLPESREQLRLMGEEPDIMIRKRSTAITHFQSRGDFVKYLKSAEAAARTDYQEWRGRLYKQNLKTAIENNFPEFPELTKGILMKIQMMNQSDFQKLIGNNRLFQIRFQYKTDKRLEHLKQMREFFGLQSELDDFEDMYDEYFS